VPAQKAGGLYKTIGQGFNGANSERLSRLRKKSRFPSFRGMFLAEESLFDGNPGKEGFLGKKHASE
jgi:hypothetical protein